MMKKIAVFLGVVFSLSLVGLAKQDRHGKRNVTNSDLETFRQKRLDAERDYRENYERMGFPSPEELAKQRDDDMVRLAALADQLRQARLEKDRIELERDKMALDAARFDSERQSAYDTTDYPDGSFWGGYEGSADLEVSDPAGRLAGFSPGTMLSGPSRVTGFYPPVDFKPSALLRPASSGGDDAKPGIRVPGFRPARRRRDRISRTASVKRIFDFCKTRIMIDHNPRF